jgi:tetratricopeptide (TPR) repeat protein
MMTTMRTLLAASLIAATASVAWAQPDELARKTAAEAAFRQGKDQIAAGDTAGACESFAKSQELDPQLGTQYNLGLCYEKLGKVASAWGLFSVLAETDTNKGRKADAGKRAKALAPKLVRVLLVARGQTPGLTVMRDGADITAAIGVATPVDPGRSVITASATGYQSWTAEVAVMGEGTTVTVEIPALEKLPEVAVPPPEPDPVPAVVVPPPPPPPSDPGPGRRRLAYISAGVGLAAIGVGATFGMMATADNDEAKRTCGGAIDDCRGDVAAAQDLVDGARTKALISTIGFAVGGAAVVGGVVLYLTAPKARERAVAIAPHVGADGGGLVVHGRW